uniref:DUF86 domain-containing protein n=1 Tax=Gracilinema caldarium TaxID=215591 RepID=A0A7C3E8G3_9SPIR
MVDKVLVVSKLESLLRCIHRIELKRPDSIDKLITDIDIQDILIVNIERAIQLAVDICVHWITAKGQVAPKTMADTFFLAVSVDLIPEDLAKKLAKAVGFRNIAVHQYQKIDWNIVYAIIWKQLEDFRRFAGYISKALDTE